MNNLKLAVQIGMVVVSIGKIVCEISKKIKA